MPEEHESGAQESSAWHCDCHEMRRRELSCTVFRADLLEECQCGFDDLRNPLQEIISPVFTANHTGRRPYDGPSRVGWARTQHRTKPWARPDPGETDAGAKFHINIPEPQVPWPWDDLRDPPPPCSNHMDRACDRPEIGRTWFG